MKDINGIEIRLGDTVRTKQPQGGILNPGPATDGIVIEYTVSWQSEPMLAIKYKKYNNIFYSHILLHGQINEIVI